MAESDFLLDLVREVVEQLGGRATVKEIINEVRRQRPDARENTIRAFLNLLSVNKPSRIHQPQNHKPRIANHPRYDAFYAVTPSEIELFDPDRHGVWEIRQEGDHTVVVDPEGNPVRTSGHEGSGVPAKVDAINKHLQGELVRLKRESVEPVEGEEWLAAAGLLEVHPTRRGKNLRDLLRADGIAGQEHLPNGRWVIHRVGGATPRQAWVVRAGEGNKYASKFEELGRVAIGFIPMGDVSGLTAKEIEVRAAEGFSEKTPQAIASRAGVVKSFALGIKLGELVLTPTETHSEVLVGRVTSGYKYAADPLVGQFRHNRAVHWLGRVQRSSLPAATQETLNTPLSVYRAGGSDALYEMFGEDAPSAASKRAWIFQGNPRDYDVRGAVKELEEDDWIVSKYRTEIKPGDRVYFWEAGRDAGIVGVGITTSEPAVGPLTVNRFVRPGSNLPKSAVRATVRIQGAADPVLTRDEVRERIPDLAILKAAMGTNFPVTPEQDEKLWQLLSSRLHPQRDPLASPKWNNAWWVNQGLGFDIESDRGVITAPTHQQNGSRAPTHWRCLADMRPNDLAFHYRGQAIAAVSRIYQDPEEVAANEVISRLPEDYRMDRWIVPAEYFVLNEPIRFSEIPVEWRLDASGPFDKNGDLKQHYANPVPETFVERMLERFSDRLRDSKPAKTNGGGPKVVPTAPPSTLVELIRRRKNVVLYGPPGTGKTREAFSIASWWEGQHGAGSVLKTTFHPSYGYEDFVQGFRPDKDDPAKFVLQPGVLLRACEVAQERDALLVVDEINRGDVARIFGELITFIEADKRGPQNSFTLAQEPTRQYFIPERLHFLGTMNTADKSVSLLDVALRRRFAFVEFSPDPGVFGSDGTLKHVEAIDLARVLTTLNTRLLAEGIEGDRAIGHALLLIDAGATDPVAELRQRVEYDIAPLVMEYSYLERDRVQRVLGDLVDAQGRFRSDMLQQEFVSLMSALTSVRPTAAPEDVSPAALIEGEAFAADQAEELDEA